MQSFQNGGKTNALHWKYKCIANLQLLLPQIKVTRKAEIMVVIDAPMKPSQVFLGDNLIKGVRPKKNPKK